MERMSGALKAYAENTELKEGDQVAEMLDRNPDHKHCKINDPLSRNCLIH